MVRRLVGFNKGMDLQSQNCRKTAQRCLSLSQRFAK